MLSAAQCLTPSTYTAVTLEGTVIHRSGTITGGNTQQGGRHFEDQEVDALRRRESELRGKLAEVFKSRPKHNAEEQLQADESRIKAELQFVLDDLSSTNSRLKGVQEELKALRKRADGHEKSIATIEKELRDLERQAAAHRDVIEREEDAIFADFCERIGVDTIREYEEKQLSGVQKDNARMLQLDKQVQRLNHQIAFESEAVDEIKKRVELLDAVAQKQRKALEQCDVDKTAKEQEIADLEQEVRDLQFKLEQLEETHRERAEALEAIRKDGSKAHKALDKALKEVASCVSGRAWTDDGKTWR